jgi:hypothetical protein
MAEGHGRDEWGRASVLLALVANCHRDPKKGRAMRPDDYNPFGKDAGEVIQVDTTNIAALKEAFLARKGI